MGAGDRWQSPKVVNSSISPSPSFLLQRKPSAVSFDFLSASRRFSMAIPSSELACVVAAVDETEESMRALTWAVDHVHLRPDGGTFVILHVQSPPSIAVGMNPGAIGGPSMEVPAFAAAVEAHQGRITEAMLNRALKICAERNVNVRTQVVTGDPKRKICEAVKNLQADLLVMGVRTLGRVKRLFSASVSKYCSKHASCPVVIISGKTGEAIQGTNLDQLDDAVSDSP